MHWLAILLGASLLGVAWAFLRARAPAEAGGHLSLAPARAPEKEVAAELDAKVEQRLVEVREPGIQLALRSRSTAARGRPAAERSLALQEVAFDLDRLGAGFASASAPDLARPEEPDVLEMLSLSPDRREGAICRAMWLLCQARVAAVLGRSATGAFFRAAGSLPQSLAEWAAGVGDGEVRAWAHRLVEGSRGGIGPARLEAMLEAAARDLGRRFPLVCFPKALGVTPDSCLASEKTQATVRDSLWNDFLSSQRQLRDTQQQLVAREKMAALGQLVAGVAHEINTPLGVAVTALSHLDDKLRELHEQFRQGGIKKSQLEGFLTEAEEAQRLAFDNLKRGAQLVASFKKVAVDQTSEERRTLALDAYLREILESLRPITKKTQLRVAIDCPELRVTTYPGALSQIVTNLVQNSIAHAFDPGQAGKLSITVTEENDRLSLTYSDDGKGMPADVCKRVFEPFFTTRRGSGGSGLGMHIVHNLVTEVLRGDITAESDVGRGTSFRVRFPKSTERPA